MSCSYAILYTLAKPAMMSCSYAILSTLAKPAMMSCSYAILSSMAKLAIMFCSYEIFCTLACSCNSNYTAKHSVNWFLRLQNWSFKQRFDCKTDLPIESQLLNDDSNRILRWTSYSRDVLQTPQKTFILRSRRSLALNSENGSVTQIISARSSENIFPEDRTSLRRTYSTRNTRSPEWENMQVSDYRISKYNLFRVRNGMGAAIQGSQFVWLNSNQHQ